MYLLLFVEHKGFKDIHVSVSGKKTLVRPLDLNRSLGILRSDCIHPFSQLLYLWMKSLNVLTAEAFVLTKIFFHLFLFVVQN